MKFKIIVAFLIVSAACNKQDYGIAVQQVPISRIEAMPHFPKPYKMLDWRKKAVDFVQFAFDFNTQMPIGPVIWIDNNQRNIPQTTFGLYTAVNDARQGPHNNNGEFHESLTSLAAIISAGLMGIDKTNQNGYNYVKMVQNYFNSQNGWNIMMNNTTPEVAFLGGGYGRDWWYDVLPNALFYAVCDLFPNVENADHIRKTIAEQFYNASKVLNGNYDFSYFDYAQMKGMVNRIPFQQDAAGGHAYVLYSAYRIYNDSRYLEEAKAAIAALESQKESRFYEILLPLGIYTAGRLNAEENTRYDTRKMIEWVFDGCTAKNGRTGWGIIVDTWGDYDVSGLHGSITDRGGYAFFMNSVKMAWPLVPLVKYEPQYARAVGKWMLNNANACRLFFPTEIDDAHQWLPEMKNITGGIVSYEGLRKFDDYGKESLKGVSPVAIGDGPKWNRKNPPESMFSLYSTAPIGILGAIVENTDVKYILRLDCNATDFYADKPFPVYLWYNPYDEEKKVSYSSGTKVDIFDIVSKTYKARNASGDIKIRIPADDACVTVILPAGKKIAVQNGHLKVEGKIIAYQ